jgi:hypothetical protein
LNCTPAYTLENLRRLKQCFQAIKQQDLNESYLETLQIGLTNHLKEILEKQRTQTKSELFNLKTIQSDSTAAVYYLFDQQTHTFSQVLGHSEAALATFRTLQLEDILSIIRTIVASDQFAWLEIGREDHLSASTTTQYDTGWRGDP